MTQPVPPPFLFRYRFPVLRNDSVPARTTKDSGRLLDLPEAARLSDILLSAEGAETRFAELRLAWNAEGLGVSVRVQGKTRLPRGSMEAPAESDGLQLWIDTRNTQANQRGGRFCHCFMLLASTGEKAGSPPGVVQLPLPRAREDAPLADTDRILQSCEATTSGYELDTWFPAGTLHGFDPEHSPALGFYYRVADSERGEQLLTVGGEFPYSHNPGLWSTLELTGG
ncbi:MAG: hypothetical protein KDA79_17010 [Planctomycetaceae bacterium]|nr:hypothetical protein [Planctomycetaceae bacterium]